MTNTEVRERKRCPRKCTSHRATRHFLGRLSINRKRGGSRPITSIAGDEMDS
jgi:hypothetical protein